MEQNTIEDLDLNEDFTFFGEVDLELKAAVEAEQAAEKKGKEDKEEEVEEEPTFFADEDVLVNPEESEETEATSPTAAIKAIFDSGYLTLDEGEEFSEENAEELFKKTFKNAVKQELKETLEALDPTTSSILKLALQGGDVESFIKTYTPEREITENMDLDKEANQKLIIRKGLEELGFDEEYINKEIERFEEDNKLKINATVHYNRWKSSREKLREKELSEAQKNYQKFEEEQEELKGYYNNLVKEESFEGLKFSKADKKDLPSYIVEGKYRLKNGQTISQFHKDLIEASQDKKKAVILAKLLREDLSLEKIKKMVESKVIDNFKEDLQRSKTPKGTSNSAKGKIYNPLDFF